MKRQPKAAKQEWPFRAENSPLTLALMHVDALIERIRNRKLKAFDPSLLEQLRKLSKSELKDLKAQYSRSYEDIKAALGGDEFFIEAYSNYDKPTMKVAMTLFKELRALKHDDAAQGKMRLGNHNPRKKKQKPPEEIVKKVLFLEKDNETGISSLKPAELVGAKELWVYNTKTRKLGCYYAKSEAGLSAKGTTVLNFDDKRSTTKTIRKPKQQIHDFIAKSPSDMHKYWDAIRAVPQAISPRLSRDTLILRAIEG